MPIMILFLLYSLLVVLIIAWMKITLNRVQAKEPHKVAVPVESRTPR